MHAFSPTLHNPTPLYPYADSFTPLDVHGPCPLLEGTALQLRRPAAMIEARGVARAGVVCVLGKDLRFATVGGEPDGGWVSSAEVVRGDD